MATDDESSNEESSPRRRRVLGLLGGTAGTVFGTGIASARPGRGRGRKNADENTGHNGVGPCTCESCPGDTFCGKIDGPPEEGKTYSFSSDDDSFSVTIEEVYTKNGGEAKCFSFSSGDTIETVCIKGGPDTATYADSPEGEKLCAPENPGGQQAGISNVSFCGTEGVECYQIDLVEGDVIEDFEEEGPYGESRRYEAFSACEDGTTTGLVEHWTVTKNGCTLTWAEMGYDASDNTASVEVTLQEAESEPCTITLAGYLLPEGDTTFDPGNLEEQTLRDYDTVSLDISESATLEINLDG
jgi:hypothetical protein